MLGIERSRIVGMSERVLDEFTCGICHEIFSDPVVTQCCRQMYCKACIEEWVETQYTCPNDRRRLRAHDLIPVPRLVLNILSNMNVKCDYYMNGCEEIVTFSELSQHLQNCSKKLESICKTCGFPKSVSDDHNCLQNLVVKIDSMTDEMEKFQKEIEELKQLNQTQRWTIKSARNAIKNDEFVIEEPSDRIDFIKQKFFIEICKEVILKNNSFALISESIFCKLNYPVTFKELLPWQVFVFSNEGGESMVRSKNYLRIRFGGLIVEIYTSGKMTS